jgi:pilus assembly protein CpaC
MAVGVPCFMLAAAGLPLSLHAGQPPAGQGGKPTGSSSAAPKGQAPAPAPQSRPSGLPSARASEPTLSILLGQSQVVKPPFQASRVSVTDPAVADVQVLTPEQLLIMGKKPGTTDLVVWSQQEQVWRTRLDVGIDVERLKGELAATFPDAQLTVSQLRNMLVVGGLLRRAEDAVQLKEFMDKSQVPYLNRTSLAGIQQVQIRVRVAEVSRNALRTLGFNAAVSTGAFNAGIGIGPSIGGAIQPVTVTPGNVAASISPAVTVFGGLWHADLQAFVQALAENQYLRVLAEPTLNCASGEQATFLAGGEFPIPVVQGSVGAGAAAGGTSISIEYKPFGVNLRFRPVVLGDNTIRLNVAPEVSDLSDVGAVIIQGFRIPSIQTRRAETTLELKSGQTFALGGLINQRIDARNSRVPGLGDLPILGSLFRSVRYNSGETELLIMVTANLVSPDNIDGRTAVPGDLHNPPNDWELFATGKLEGAASPKLSPADAKWLRDQGLDQLRGPGAWATYEAPLARSTAMSRPGAGGQPPSPRLVETRPLEMVPVAPSKPTPPAGKPTTPPPAPRKDKPPAKPAAEAVPSSGPSTIPDRPTLSAQGSFGAPRSGAFSAAANAVGQRVSLPPGRRARTYIQAAPKTPAAQAGAEDTRKPSDDTFKPGS